jgi:7,8-dihydropterin-6-yl-methyl-4-(beta-D-ribofuranosyl)aminobenzene 5'-phosphate synthase
VNTFEKGESEMNTATGRVTILTDNVVPGKSEAIGEHGFCAYVETRNGNFLFDTGHGKTVVHNALLFKKDLSRINKIVLSHAHGDHSGGLPEVLRCRSQKQIDVYAHPDIFSYAFTKKGGGETYNGIPFTRGYIEKMGARFIFNREWVEIETGLYLTGEVPRKTDFERADMADRFIRRDGEDVPDIILDDQSMAICTGKGILIVLGCAHSGMINVVNHIIQNTGIEAIYGIIGGTHLGFSEEAQLRESIRTLKSYRIQHFIPSHCTGLEVISRMKQEFEKAFRFSHVGLSLEF